MLDFKPQPFAHVVRGPYGRPSIGGAELSSSADAANDAAFIWFVTGDQAYAAKAIEIINAWSATLWDFDDNDAKLLAGWTGQTWCNAAEILCGTDAGWQPRDIEQFKRMLRTVYHPLIGSYFPEANSNWDAAIAGAEFPAARLILKTPAPGPATGRFAARSRGGASCPSTLSDFRWFLLTSET